MSNSKIANTMISKTYFFAATRETVWSFQRRRISSRSGFIRPPLIQQKVLDMGWSFKWMSSLNSDFNYDMGVSFTTEKKENNEITYNYGKQPYFSITLKIQAMSLAMGAYQKDVKIIKGKVSVNTITYNGDKVQRHHCDHCGTTLQFTADKYLYFISIKPGTFAETNWFRPIAHFLDPKCTTMGLF